MGNNKSSGSNLNITESTYNVSHSSDIQLQHLRSQSDEYDQMIVLIQHFLNDILENKDQISSYILKIVKHIKRRNYKPLENIFTADDSPQHLYLLYSGRVEILSTDLTYNNGVPCNVILDVLQPGSYFGEVPIFWGGSYTHAARSRTDTTLLELPTDVFGGNNLDLPRPQLVLEEWYVHHRYLPDRSDMNSASVLAQICRGVLKMVALFENWEDSALDALIQKMGPYPLVLYPELAVVAYTGDPAHWIQVLVAGSVDVHSTGDLDQEPIETFQAKTIPYVFGEQVLFDETQTTVLSLVASSPCYVLQIPLQYIEAVVSKQPRASVTRKSWKTDMELWWEKLTKAGMTSDIESRAFLQLEVLYKRYRMSPAFKKCSPLCVYRLARSSTCTRVLAGNNMPQSKLGPDVSFVYIVQGSLMVHDEDKSSGKHTAYSDGTLLDSTLLHGSKIITASCDTTVAVAKDKDVTSILKRYPQSELQITSPAKQNE